ncbi:MAG TPA: LCP family protein [Acidimicrobiia bacterium]
MSRFSLSESRTRWALFVLAIALFGVLGWFAASAFRAWSGLGRVDLDRMTTVAAEEPDEEPSPDDTAVPEFRLPPIPSAKDGIDTFLMVGTDSRDHLEDLEGFGDFEGARADVLLLLIRPRNDQEKAAIVSLPRDLWVSTPCGQMRINDTLQGCDDMNGESTLLATVESLTGLGVDHVAIVDMAGFQEVVDRLGGYEICVEHPVRDRKAKLDLPAGCHLADGADTLAWLRSRNTQEQLEDGRWVRMDGVNDLTRNERQRKFLMDMLGRLGNFQDPQEALETAQAIAPFVTVDRELGLTQAVSLAWSMRGLDDDLTEIDIPVEDYQTEAGAQVLIASVDIESIIADVIAVETVGQAERHPAG